jgi:thiamine kinase-like enzyme
MADRFQVALRQVPGYDPDRSSVSTLGGGITNENFRVDTGSGSFVVRLAGLGTEALGIVREAELASARIAAGLGVAPEVVGAVEEAQALICRFVEAPSITPESAARPDVLGRFAASLRRVHEGPSFPGHFSPFETVRTYYGRARSVGVHFPPGIDRVLDRMSELERSLAGKRPNKPCHNDLLAGNLLDDGAQIWILDWEYAAMGDPFFDLGNFCVNLELDEEATRVLLREYLGQDRDEDLLDVGLMRSASDLREAFWGFLQSGLSSLDFNYRGYAMKHLERFNG